MKYIRKMLKVVIDDTTHTERNIKQWITEVSGEFVESIQIGEWENVKHKSLQMKYYFHKAARQIRKEKKIEKGGRQLTK